MTTQYVEYDERDGIGYITLNRPEVLNALNDDVLKQLREAMFLLDDDDDAQVGIISGAGTSFCSGADIKQRQMRPVGRAGQARQPAGTRGAHRGDLCRASRTGSRSSPRSTGTRSAAGSTSH